MDVLIAILFSVMSATTTGCVVAYNIRQTAQPLHGHHFSNKWRLPPPGLNLELYTKVKGLLDTLEHERNEARRERDKALAELEESQAELVSSRTALEESQEELVAIEERLNKARDIVRSYTHAKMEIFVEPRLRSTKPKISLVV